MKYGISCFCFIESFLAYLLFVTAADICWPVACETQSGISVGGRYFNTWRKVAN